MRLHELLQTVDGQTSVPDIEITGIEIDSRRVQPGNLFVALPCPDVENHIKEAFARGAVTVVRERGEGEGGGACAHKALVRLCQAFFSPLPQHLLAVTGTNGKSSTVMFASQLLAAVGYRAASVGTLGVHLQLSTEDDETLPAPDMTTYDMPVLYRLLRDLAERNITCACIEATSHGLEQGRLDGLHFRAGALTNVTQDHLDYHKTMTAYARAKRRLFETRIEEGGVAVLNRSSAFFEEFFKPSQERGLHILTYGVERKDVSLSGLNLRHEGDKTVLDLDLLGERFAEVPFRLIGRFQVENLLCALGLVLGTFPDVDRMSLVSAISALKAIPGRMEVLVAPNGAHVIVDFCHTPDALARVLDELHLFNPRRLTVVFGCGGERDPSKRPLMARIAEERADHIIVTDDNPRSENPGIIRAEIAAGLTRPFEDISGRKEAIEHALHDLAPGDVLLIAGRGHEAFQKVGTERIPFQDRAVVEAFWKHKDF